MKAPRSLVLTLTTTLAAIAGPWAVPVHATAGLNKFAAAAAIKATWLAPGSSVPYARSRFGVVLASVECFPTYILRLPPGLVTLVQREAYVATHQAEIQAIPCAYLTKLSELRPTNAIVDHEQERFQVARVAYNTALSRGKGETVAVGNAQAAFDTDAPILAASSGQLAMKGRAGVRPDVARDSHPPTLRRVRACCSTGSFYQYNYDTLLNSNKQVQAHVDWELWYDDLFNFGAGTYTHTFHQTKFHIIDGGPAWFQWSEIDSLTPCCTVEFGVGSTGNDRAATPFNAQGSNTLTYNFNSQSTSDSYLAAVNYYCVSVDAFGACTLQFKHGASVLAN